VLNIDVIFTVNVIILLLYCYSWCCFFSSVCHWQDELVGSSTVSHMSYQQYNLQKKLCF